MFVVRTIEGDSLLHCDESCVSGLVKEYSD